MAVIPVRTLHPGPGARVTASARAPAPRGATPRAPRLLARSGPGPRTIGQREPCTAKTLLPGAGCGFWRRVRAGLLRWPWLTLVSGCGLVGGPTALSANVPDQMTVTSQAFNQPVPADLHLPRLRASPSLHWSGAPQRTKSLALLVDDASAPIQPYIYWIVFDIGPQTTGIQAGQVPPGARQADNSKGTDRYDPPCPVNGRHMYRFTVYALSRSLSLPERRGHENCLERNRTSGHRARQATDNRQSVIGRSQRVNGLGKKIPKRMTPPIRSARLTDQ